MPNFVSSLLAHTFRQALVILACCVAQPASAVGSSLEVAGLPVVYVGADGVQTDLPYQRFAHALKRRAALLKVEVALEYVNVPVMAVEKKKRVLASLLAKRPAVLIAPTAATALAAAQQPRNTTIIFSSAPDPVRAGIVKSLREPGPLITGVSLADDWHAKRIELLRDAFPKGRRLGVLLDRNWANYEDFAGLIGKPAETFGYLATPFLADTPAEARAVLQGANARLMDAWYIPPNYIAYLAEREIIEQLQHMNVPAMHATEQEVANGALMAFAQDASFASEAMADLTLRILRGEDAGAIPVQRAKKFVLAVRPRDNLGAPQIHPAVIRRADRVY